MIFFTISHRTVRDFKIGVEKFADFPYIARQEFSISV